MVGPRAALEGVWGCFTPHLLPGGGGVDPGGPESTHRPAPAAPWPTHPHTTRHHKPPLTCTHRRQRQLGHPVRPPQQLPARRPRVDAAPDVIRVSACASARAAAAAAAAAPQRFISVQTKRPVKCANSPGPALCNPAQVVNPSKALQHRGPSTFSGPTSSHPNSSSALRACPKP